MTSRQQMFAVRFVLILLLSFTVYSSAFAEMDFIIDARPGTLLLSADDLKVKGNLDDQLSGLTVVEEAGTLNTLPNVRAGVGFDENKWLADVTGTAGILVNERFRAFLLGFDASAQYKYRKNFSLGPHLGLLFAMSPEWTGDASVELTDTQGVTFGVQMSVGYDVLFVFGVDYFLMDPMEVTTSDGWIAESDELDISGLAIQFGIRGRF